MKDSAKIIVKSALCLVAASLLAISSLGCDLMDNTTGDPDPPVLVNAFIAPGTPNQVWPDDEVSILISWYDPGQDIERATFRDQESGEKLNGIWLDPKSGDRITFPGVSGTGIWTLDLANHQAGVHNVLVFLEDSNKSKSNAITVSYIVKL